MSPSTTIADVAAPSEFSAVSLALTLNSGCAVNAIPGEHFVPPRFGWVFVPGVPSPKYVARAPRVFGVSSRIWIAEQALCVALRGGVVLGLAACWWFVKVCLPEVCHWQEGMAQQLPGDRRPPPRGCRMRNWWESHSPLLASLPGELSEDQSLKG